MQAVVVLHCTVQLLTPPLWPAYYVTPPLSTPAGTYCQYAVVDEDQLALLPQGVDVATAGGVPLVALTAWQALQAGQPQPGKRVLIMAASGGAHATL
jgi:NADPH:quinone reductase-like Zn-dependent oxidoreductase